MLPIKEINEAEIMNKQLGGDFDEFLREENLQEEATAAALKHVFTWQLEQGHESTSDQHE